MFLLYFAFQHVSLLFTMIYYFDVVGLAFLGQDIFKFHVCAQIYMFMLRSTCLCLDLRPFGPRVMPMFRSMCLCAPFHFCMLRSTCLCFLCHVYSQIYVPMFRSMSLWAPCHVYVQIHVFMCSVPCLCAQIYILVANAMCFYSPFVPRYLSFLCFGPCWWGVDLDPVVQAYIHIPRPISKSLGHFPTCLCMLACFCALCLCLPFQI